MQVEFFGARRLRWRRALVLRTEPRPASRPFGFDRFFQSDPSRQAAFANDVAAPPALFGDGSAPGHRRAASAPPAANFFISAGGVSGAGQGRRCGHPDARGEERQLSEALNSARLDHTLLGATDAFVALPADGPERDFRGAASPFAIRGIASTPGDP
jgi:hypothetical protein